MARSHGHPPERGADLHAWHAEATPRDGEVAPFAPRNHRKTLENAVKTAHRDLFYRQPWAGYDRREVDVTPELAFLVDGAAGRGVSTHGATLYGPWFACRECARATIFGGIKEVVGHAERMAGAEQSGRR
jgi:hypothetical protein